MKIILYSVVEMLLIILYIRVKDVMVKYLIFND